MDAFERINNPAGYIINSQKINYAEAIDNFNIKYSFENGFAIINGLDSYNVNLVSHGTVYIDDLKKIQCLHDKLIYECKGSILKHALKKISKPNKNMSINLYFDKDLNKEYISVLGSNMYDEFVRIYEDLSIKKNHMQFGNYVERPEEVDDFVISFMKILYEYV